MSSAHSPPSLPVNISSYPVMVGLWLGCQMNRNDWNVRSERPEVKIVGRNDVLDPEQVGVDGVVVNICWCPLQ